MKGPMPKRNDEAIVSEAVLREQIQRYARQNRGQVAAAGEDFVRQLVKTAYEALLETEMEEHLGYEKYARSGRGSGNSRNGKSKKRVKGEYGEVEIVTPRDRKGSFEPEIIKKHSSEYNGFGDKVISLYTRGMTTREIQEHIREMYDIELPASFVSRATERIVEDLEG